MKKFRSHTLKEYLDVLSRREPVPGGGSASALTAAAGAALLSMVANYSKGRGQSKLVEKQIQKTLSETEKIRTRLLELVDLDAESYLKVVRARKASAARQKAAAKAAGKVPVEICKLCYKAIGLTPVLVKKGNPHLINDVEVAAELLLAAFNGALYLVDAQ